MLTRKLAKLSKVCAHPLPSAIRADATCSTDWDLVFADDERESNPTSFKFLQMAHAWKSAQAKNSGGGTTVLSGFTAATSASAASEDDGKDKDKGRDKGRDKGGDGDAASDVASSHGGDSDD